MKTMKRGIMTAFCILATLTFGLILFLGCAKPSNNLISWQMTLGTVATTGAVLILFRLYQRFLSKGNRQSDHLFYLLFTIWGGILILSGILCPSHASAMIDYRTMYLFASATDIGDDFSDYFAKYNNNFKPALYLRFVYRLGEKIGFQDPYYLIMAVGVLIVLLSALSARYLLGCHSRKLQRSLQIPILITFMVFLPIYPLCLQLWG